jgi:hypothetical protein
MSHYIQLALKLLSLGVLPRGGFTLVESRHDPDCPSLSTGTHRRSPKTLCQPQTAGTGNWREALSFGLTARGVPGGRAPRRIGITTSLFHVQLSLVT